MDRVAEENPNVVEELVPKLLSLAVVQKVLQNLMREQVSIQDRATVIETLDGAAPITKNTLLSTEYVRRAIRGQVVGATAYFPDAALEQAIEPAVEHSEYSSHLVVKAARTDESKFGSAAA